MEMKADAGGTSLFESILRSKNEILKGAYRPLGLAE